MDGAVGVGFAGGAVGCASKEHVLNGATVARLSGHEPANERTSSPVAAVPVADALSDHHPDTNELPTTAARVTSTVRTTIHPSSPELCIAAVSSEACKNRVDLTLLRKSEASLHPPFFVTREHHRSTFAGLEACKNRVDLTLLRKSEAT